MPEPLQPAAIALLCDPVTHAPLQPGPPHLLERLRHLTAQRALRQESAALVAADFDGVLVAADGRRAWLVRQGVTDFMPGAAVLLAPDDLLLS